MTDIHSIITRVRREVGKRFPSLSQDFKEDLVQEGITAYLESVENGEAENGIHWIVVRSISAYYWANISIVKRKRPQAQKPKNKKAYTDSRSGTGDDVIFQSDKDIADHDMANAIIDMDTNFQEIGKRIAQEYLLVPSAKKLLQEREWTIIEARILNQGRKTTRPEIARKLDISVERVRQIENQGLIRLNKYLSNPKSPLQILHPGY